jgi:hypothetical protein
MSIQINQLVKSLLQKDSLDQCSLQELQHFADRNPYFGAAQLLLTKKLQIEKSDRYNEQLQKTFLFFHNPMWVEHLLNENGAATITRQQKKKEDAVAISTQEIATPVAEQPSNNVQHETATTSIAEQTIIKEEQSITTAGIADIEEPAIPTLPTESTPLTVVNTEESNPQYQASGTAIAEEAIVKEEKPVIEIQTASAEVISVPSIEEIIADTNAAIVAEPETVTPSIIKEDTIVTSQSVVTIAEESVKEIPGLKIEAIDPSKTALTFEPYHTVDYFASQGIKFKEEEKPKDKFGQQLKSFTDWLKTMKKIPVTEITKTVEPSSEKKVEQLAQHSLDEKEVVTEAMAEVWEKQGNAEKATQVYSKLSLLEPSKSTYFAAKIEELKKKI